MKARIMLLVFFLVNLATPLFAGVNTEPPTAPGDFLVQMVTTLEQMGGLSGVMKVSAIITLLISSMKVSVLNDVIWKKLGAGQVYVAPLLGIIIGLIRLSGGAPLTTTQVALWLLSGSGAVFLHEILDSVKQIPGLGTLYVAGIAIAERFLGGGSSSQDQAQPKP